MKSCVRTVLDKTADLRRAMQLLTKQEVMVGIPADNGQRSGDLEGPVTNAQLGYIHEHGSPARNIPPRPFLVPGIQVARDPIVDQLRDAGKQALDGNAGGVSRALDKAGLIAQNSVRARFVDNDWPALAESTLGKRPAAERDKSGKVRRRKKSRRERGAVNPLIDTGQMRKAVTYVVRKRTG